MAPKAGPIKPLGMPSSNLYTQHTILWSLDPLRGLVIRGEVWRVHVCMSNKNTTQRHLMSSIGTNWALNQLDFIVWLIVPRWQSISIQANKKVTYGTPQGTPMVQLQIMMIPIKLGNINSTSLESRSWLWQIYYYYYILRRPKNLWNLPLTFDCMD